MICKKCGTSNDEKAEQCQTCRSILKRGTFASSAANSSHTTSNTSSQNQNSTSSKYIKVLSNRKFVFCSIVILGCLALLATIVTPAISSIFTPKLTDKMILSEQNDSSDSMTFTNSSWASNTGYQRVDAEVTDRTESEQTDSQTGNTIPIQIVNVKTVYENNNFRATVHQNIRYAYRDKWGIDSIDPEDITIMPISGISNTAITNNIADIISAVDETPRTDSNGNAIYLSELYQDDYMVDIIDNATDANGGTVNLTISNKRGILEHHGKVQVTFEWGGTDWTITQATATSEAYIDDYSSLEGIWNGTLQSNKSYRQPCYGGKNNPLKFEVTHVDSTAKTMIMNISLLVHNHKYLEQSAADTTQGDTYYTIPNVTVDFSKLNNGGTIFDSQIWKDGSTVPYFIQITATINPQGEISARTKTGQYTSEGAGFLWEFYDSYTMDKATA